MDKLVATGASGRKDARKAADEATQAALQRLGSRKAAFGFAFVSGNLDLALAMAEVRRHTGAADILGASSAGVFTAEGRSDEGVAVLLVASDETRHRAAFARGMKHHLTTMAQRFTEAALDAKRQARATGHRQLTSVLLTDGLAGTGEDLVQAVFEQSASVSQIVGGAAGDGGRFKETFVAAGDECASDAAAILHVFDAKPWGVGLDHGLHPTTKPMRVTSAQGNVIHTIEGQPAFEVYRRHARERGVTLTRDRAVPYMIANELGIHFLASLSRVRAPLGVGEDGSLTCAAPVPEGSFVSILDGERRTMIAAAKSAAEDAKRRLGKSHAAGVLVFDCVCRGMILQDDFHREIEAIRQPFGDVPVAGFLTYGEIAKYAGRLEGWHNATAVVVAIPA